MRRKTKDQRPETGPPEPNRLRSLVSSLWSLVFLSAALLALRKPWALHTPQFWAEDGEIFMNQDDATGSRVFFEPYNGYLHLLPRLIAWMASSTADVAWWPAIYNGLAYAITVGLFARLASQRIELPAKPWLMLSWVLVAHNGEVVTNVTNLQWFAAFYLVLALFTARPTTQIQRVGDLAIIGLVGLNGPFAILFLPLFAWRAWRERRADTVLALLAVASCAALQGWFLAGTTLNLQGAGAPFDPLRGFAILGNRLVSWTVFGPSAVSDWPLWVHAIIGAAVLFPLLAWALRPDPRRPVRATLIMAFCIVTVASMVRARMDTWADADLTSGDRYNYIPRVLLAWLLILEFDTSPRAIAHTARALCLLGVLTNAPHFILPAPPDYRWAEHCDPIRRGVPANIFTLPEGYWIDYRGRPTKP